MKVLLTRMTATAILFKEGCLMMMKKTKLLLTLGVSLLTAATVTSQATATGSQTHAYEKAKVLLQQVNSQPEACPTSTMSSLTTFDRCCPTCPETNCDYVAAGCCGDYHFAFTCYVGNPSGPGCLVGSCDGESC